MLALPGWPKLPGWQNWIAQMPGWPKLPGYPWPVAMATGHGHWPWPLAMATGHGCWPWPLAMGIRAILAIRASGQSNSAIRAILAIRAIQASGHPGIRKPPGAPMGHRGPDPIDRPEGGSGVANCMQQFAKMKRYGDTETNAIDQGSGGLDVFSNHRY